MNKKSFLQAIMQKKMLTHKEFDSLLLSSDLLEVNSDGNDTIMYALMCNAFNQLFLSNTQWDYLIRNSDLKKANLAGINALAYYITCHGDQKVELTPEQRTYLFNNSNLQQLSFDNESVVNYVFKEKNLINNLFTQEQTDYLVDNVPLNLTSDYVSGLTKAITQKNYEEYKIDKEKRMLLSQVHIPSTITVQSEVYKI